MNWGKFTNKFLELFMAGNVLLGYRTYCNYIANIIVENPERGVTTALIKAKPGKKICVTKNYDGTYTIEPEEYSSKFE